MARKGYEEVLKYVLEVAGTEDVSDLAKQIMALGEKGEVSADKAQQLADQLTRLTDATGNIQKFTQLKAQLVDTGAALDKARARAGELRKEFDAADAPSKRLERSMAAADRQVDRLERTLNRQKAQLTATSNALDKAGVDTNALSAAYSRLDGEIGELGAEVSRTTARMVQAGREGKAAAGGIGALEKAAKGSSDSLRAIATRLGAVMLAAKAAYATLQTFTGITLFGGALVSARNLEDALTEVQAVSGATADEMERLKAAAKQGGAATRFSTLEAAQGLGELARATGSATSAIAALPAALNLAQAAGIGVADAAQFITTTLTQFGLGAENASRVADVLAKAANSTTADVRGLGDALTYAAPLAKQLGLDAEQTVAVIGALADQGFRGERAGTALRNVFSELLEPTSAFAKGLRDIGIESSDFATVIEQLAAKGQLGRDALMSLDAAARPAILALVDSGGTALRQLESDLRNAAGSAEATARQIGDSFAGADESLRDTLDRTRRALVEPILEPLRVELFALSKELEAFAGSQDFADIKDALKDLFIEGAAAARALLKETDFKALAADIKAFVGDASETMAEFRENVTLVVGAVELVGDAFSVVFNGVQTIILGVAAAVAKLLEIQQRVASVLTFLPRKMGEFATGTDEVSRKIDEYVGGMGAVYDEFGRRAVKNFHETIEAAKDFGDISGTSAEAARVGLQATAEALDKAGVAGAAAAQAAQATSDAATAAAAAMRDQGNAAGESAEKTAAAAGDMEQGAARLRQAFADLGISSQADLSLAAEAARRNFDLIRQAVARGEATVDDARRAMKAYAQAARAAAADSNQSSRERVEDELAVLNAVTAGGQALEQLGTRGGAAGEAVSSGATAAAGAMDTLASSANNAASAVGAVGGGTAAATGEMKEGAKAAQGMAFSIGQVGDGFTETWREMSRSMEVGSNPIKKLALLLKELSTQRNEVRAYSEELDAMASSYDGLAERRAELQKKYDFVGKDEIEAILQKEQAIESARKAQNEKYREAAEQQRQQDEARLKTAEQLDQIASKSLERTSAVKDGDDKAIRIEFVPPSNSQVSNLTKVINDLADLVVKAATPKIIQAITRSKASSNAGKR